MKIQRIALAIIVALLGLLAVLPTTLAFAQAGNHVPAISADFPDTVLTKQGVAHRDSIFALPLADFGYDADGDSLIWSTSTEDSIGAFFSPTQETLYVHSAGDWYGRGRFTVRLEDSSGAYDEKEVAVVAFKRDGTLLSKDGSEIEHCIPWNSELDINRISSVENFLIEEGYDEKKPITRSQLQQIQKNGIYEGCEFHKAMV